MRRLTADEHALWRKVAGTVRPTGGARPRPLPVMPALVPSPMRAAPAIPASVRPLPKPAAPSANTLDGGWDKRLARGAVAPDMTIDLHGETASSAHRRLEISLGAAIRNGARLVLLITGRPARDNPRLPPTSRGVIRASVHDWLDASPHAGSIAAVRNAHPRHGGAGALYLVLRRPRGML